MKWKTLSDESRALIRELDRPFGFGRGARMKRLRELGEPAALISLMALLVSSGSGTAKASASLMAAIVSQTPMEMLGAVDERMRSDWLYGPANFYPEHVDGLHFGDDTPVVLGLVSCTANGYVRQRAVLRLDREVNDGQEIPFLLLRLSDWVDEVRQDAERAIERRLHESQRPGFLKCLPQIVRLQDRTRATQSRIFTRITELLLVDPPGLTRIAFQSTDPATRRTILLWTWASIPPTDVDRQRAVVEIMLQSVEPVPRLRVALWLAGGQMAPELAREIIPRLISDSSAAVRRTSLAWQAAHHPEQCLPELRSALLDSSLIMRSVAQFFLPKIEAIDLRAFYRHAVQNSQSRQATKGAIGGLSETGRSEDVEWIVPFVRDPRVAIRSAAIRAVGRMAAKDHAELLIDALQDSSPGVSRAARDALERHIQLVDPDRLAEICARAKDRHVRKQVSSLLVHLPKWQAVAHIVECLRLNDETMNAMVESFLHTWLRDYNRTHQIQPSAAELARFRQALGDFGHALPRALREELSALADSIR